MDIITETDVAVVIVTMVTVYVAEKQNKLYFDTLT